MADTAGAGLAALALVGLEGRGWQIFWRHITLLGSFAFDDPTVNLGCGSPLHLARHMGVDIQGIRIIREAYENHLRNGSFVEDVRGY